MRPTFLTIGVSYRTDAEAVRFATELTSLSGYDRGVVLIVANDGRSASPDSPLNFLETAPNVIVEYSRENLGYFGAASWAFSRYLERHEMPEWVIVSNVDIEFPDRDIFSKLLQYHGDSCYGAIAPDIRLETDGRLPSSNTSQNPHMAHRPSIYKLKLLELIASSVFSYAAFETLSAMRYTILNRLRSIARSNITTADRDRIQEIYAPFGAFIIFHSRYFNAGAGLKYGGFLYGEELFVAEQIAEHGLRAVFDSRLKVIHREHCSTNHTSVLQRAQRGRESIRHLMRTYY